MKFYIGLFFVSLVLACGEVERMDLFILKTIVCIAGLLISTYKLKQYEKHR